MSKDIIEFDGDTIRRTWHNEEWWFVVEDIIKALTGSRDPKQYIQKLKQRDQPLAQGWVQFVHTLPIETSGGKQRMNSANTEGCFRIIQSIPSTKAEPFKLWLAKAGYETAKDIQNPERMFYRIKAHYKSKGYSEQWIQTRASGMEVRNKLTNEWDNRGAHKKSDYALLTADISKATFGMTPTDLKDFKHRKQQPLRDHMNTMELILNMLGEETTTQLHNQRNSQGVSALQNDAKDGGGIAGTARRSIEKALGQSIVSSKNYLDQPEDKKRVEHNA